MSPTYDKTALLQVARLDDQREDWKKAAQEYQQLAELFPNDPFILEPLARVQRKLGLVKAWRETLAKAVAAYRSMGLVKKAEQCEAKLNGLSLAAPI